MWIDRPADILPNDTEPPGYGSGGARAGRRRMPEPADEARRRKPWHDTNNQRSLTNYHNTPGQHPDTTAHHNAN